MIVFKNITQIYGSELPWGVLDDIPIKNIAYCSQGLAVFSNT